MNVKGNETYLSQFETHMNSRQLVDISKLGLNSKIKTFSYSFICGKGYSPSEGENSFLSTIWNSRGFSRHDKITGKTFVFCKAVAETQAGSAHYLTHESLRKIARVSKASTLLHKPGWKRGRAQPADQVIGAGLKMQR